ncbi:MAG: (2Fe-2S)-binding protein [Burkholderiales bacterium]|nr:(2Fe-2S)-binding protein [Burkholderiales bacterium]
MERREFLAACASACTLRAGEAWPAATLEPRFYFRARLTDAGGAPLRASRLVAGRNYLFHYPYEATPCFLLNLGRPAGAPVELKTGDGSVYQWPGGVGPGRALVAYSAICAHRMTYPTRQISFISYRERSTSPASHRPNVIHCCSEHSEYDPATGARVVGGPAAQPLPAILLEYDAAGDGLTAVGTLGRELFNAFFEKFGFKLALDYGPGMRRRIAERTAVVELEAFCKQQVRC